MQRVDIPAGVTRIGDYVFQNCNSLKTLVCYPIEPPIIGNEVFFQVSRVPRLYTPYDSMDSYKWATDWYKYDLDIYAIEWGIQ